MWKISLPSVRRSSYLTSGYMAHVVQILLQHKFIVLIITIIILGSSAIMTAAVRHTTAPTQLGRSTSTAGQSSDLTATQTLSESQQTQSVESKIAAPESAPIVSPGHTSASTEITVNNQTIPVPKNGTVHTTVPTQNGSSSVSINVDAHSTNAGASSSSSFVQLNSNSAQSQVTIQNSQ